ncbi:phosphoglycerol transferase [Paenibacillus yonginensis]|uniref:Phosphoglycerol transferase n=1 Tax=Paenibacillus yonginensis TaxID=1462996 RepID=A0A1B1MXC4_9BACL|nr:LTA synthase family protein [Paenibacillus yonginensis]ANS73816.1 phosphoglycerol transferase [Paenibacillus yonginensis]
MKALFIKDSPPDRLPSLIRKYGVYLLFLIVMVLKLWYLHTHLHARYIDMNKTDFVIAMGSLMLVSFWTLWLSVRAEIIALLVLDLLLTALIYSDLVYYRYFQDFITVPVLLQAGQVGELGDSIKSLLHSSDLRFAADWIALIVLFPIYKILRRRRRASYRVQAAPWKMASPSPSLSSVHSYSANGSAGSNRGHKGLKGKGLKETLLRLSSGLAAFILGLALTLGPIKSYTSTWAAGLFTGNYWSMSLYNVTGLLGFHFYDIYRFAKDHIGGDPLTAQEKEEMKQWFAAAGQSRDVRNATFGAYKGSNVIVIQTEALMNFMIGKQIGGQEVTPNLNKLQQTSLYFSNYYHQTGQGRTSDADFASNGSLHPLPSGSVATRFADHKFDVMPQILKEEDGYHAFAFHAYDSSFWNRLTMYNSMGYDRFFSKKDYQMDEPLGWSLGDKSFFKQSLGMLSEEQQPFYAFMITLTSHHPYTLPEKVQTLDVGSFKGTIFGDYLEAVHYVDEAIGELIDQMKAEGLWDNTILCIYGDHDNSVADQADYEKFLGRSLNELDMHKIMNQVPLFIHLPDDKLAGTYAEAEGQLDLAPSLLHLLGISTADKYMMGNNMFDGNPNHLVVLRTGAFTDGRVHYIPSPDGLFENGSCYSEESGEKVAIGSCRAGSEEAQKRLQISDEVITYDLIRQLEQEKSTP